jgi:hypothetical protein
MGGGLCVCMCVRARACVFPGLYTVKLKIRPPTLPQVLTVFAT